MKFQWVFINLTICVNQPVKERYGLWIIDRYTFISDKTTLHNINTILNLAISLQIQNDYLLTHKDKLNGLDCPRSLILWTTFQNKHISHERKPYHKTTYK